MSNPRRRQPAVKWIAFAAVALLIFLAAGFTLNGVASTLVRDRAMRALRENFGGQLELKDMSVTVFPHFRLSGDGLVIHYHGRTDLPPLITVRRFSAEGGLISLLAGHIAKTRLEGLEIQVPPKSERTHQQEPGAPRRLPVVIDEIQADGTILKTLPKNPDKEPLEWDIRLLTLHGASASSPMSFHATLINAKPPGDIETTGKFGPWQAGEPADTPVEGSYKFQNADLSVFKGISGSLSSQGTYRGELERIEVQGTTDTPGFALKVSGNPVHLTTQFQAVVDGTDGDTELQPVKAQFGRSSVVARGSVEGTKGVKGKTISLDVQVDDGHLEDMLRLAVKGAPTMRGGVSFHAKLTIPPGDIDVAQKMKLDGAFTAQAARFSRTDIEEKVTELSHRGKGEPEAPPTDNVASDFAGHFKIGQGLVSFQNLSFRVPGVQISLRGDYSLGNQQMDFHGRAKLEAKLSETTTGFKSFLLKAVDPFFKKKNTGADIPIKITGSRDQPSFGLDL